MNITDAMTIGIFGIGYVYIVVKSFNWFLEKLFNGFGKFRKLDRQQKAVNEFFDAFDLHEQLKSCSSVSVRIKGGITFLASRDGQ